MACLIHVCSYMRFIELPQAPKLKWEIGRKVSHDTLPNRPQSSCCHEVLLGCPNSENECDTLEKLSPNPAMFSEAKPSSTGPSGIVGVLTAAAPQRASPLPIPARVAGFLYFISSKAFPLGTLVFVQIWCTVNCIYFRYFLLCMCQAGLRQSILLWGLVTKFSGQLITLWNMHKRVCVYVCTCACTQACLHAWVCSEFECCP